MSYSTKEIRIRATEALARGLPAGVVSRSFGVNRSTLYRWKIRLKNEGPEGLERRDGSGRPRSIDPEEGSALLDLILDSALDYGFETDFWTCRRILSVAKDQCGIDVSKWTVWRRLREADLTYKKPERKWISTTVVQGRGASNVEMSIDSKSTGRLPVLWGSA